MTGPFEAISGETLDALQKALTSGVTSTTGVFGYRLDDVVSLVPVVTPFWERVPRKASPEGAQNAVWRAITNVNNQQPSPFVGLDAGGNFIKINEQDVYAPFLPVRVSGEVTRDAIDLARGYADPKVVASFQTLMQWRILDAKAMLVGGQNFALPTIAQPTVTAATTGGTIASGTTLYVQVAARSGYNFYWGGSGVASTAANVAVGTTTSTNKVTAVVAAVRGAVAYDWWTSTNGSTYYYATTTTVPTAVFTATLSAGASVPNIPQLYSTAPSNTPPASDTSYSTNSYNSVLATLAGSYPSSAGNLVSYGTGGSTASGATWTDLGGLAFTATAQGIAELDQLNANIYNTAQLSPTVYVVSPQEATNIGSKILATNAAVTYLQPANGRTGIEGGGQVGSYVNRTTGDRIEILTDPNQPVGTLLALTERIPYPSSGIANTFEVSTLREVSEFPYAATLTPGGAGSGPRDLWSTDSLETFVNRAPVACGWISGIANG